MLTGKFTYCFKPFLLSLFCVLGSQICGVADDHIKIRAQLIWGSNDPEFELKRNDLTKADPKLKKRLKDVFQWQYYWEKNKDKNRIPIVVKKDKSQKVKLTKNTEIEIKFLGNEEVEVKLFGKEKLFVTKRQKLAPKCLVVLAGEAEDMNAWFVIISPHQ